MHIIKVEIITWVITTMPPDKKKPVMKKSGKGKQSKARRLDGLEQLISLQTASTSIISKLELGEVLNTVTCEMTNLLNAKACVLAEWDVEKNVLRVLSEHRPDEEGEVEADTNEYPIEGYPSIKKTLVEKKEVQICVSDKDITKPELDMLQAAEAKSLLLLPLVFQDRVVGLVELYSSEEDKYEEKEIIFAKLLSDLAAIAIKNTLLFETAQKEIERRERLEEKLQHDALHDTLTGLPNRTLFLDRLRHVIIRTKRSRNELFAVLLVDLDKFKVVNDSMSHLAGDELLARTARLLEECVREADTVSRYGGDEFLILLEGVEGIDEVTHISKRIQEKISMPLEIQENEILISASTGIVMSSSEYVNPEEYIRDADIAMYHVKMKGKGRYQIFTDDLRSSFFKRLTLESDLQRAIKNEEFDLHYQPILSLETRKIKGFEALLRWEKSRLGPIYPNEFIPLAEETGHIVELGYWVIKEACEQLLRWHKKYTQIPHWQMSINISSKQLYQPDFVENVENIIREIGVDPGNIIFEITESAYIGETAFVAKSLRRLQELGIKVYLDDFGTGYSALSYIDDFPIDALKIAGSFVTSFNPEDKKRGMIHTIIRMAQDFGLEIVAEGIETADQANKLGDIG